METCKVGDNVRYFSENFNRKVYGRVTGINGSFAIINRFDDVETVMPINSLEEVDFFLTSSEIYELNRLLKSLILDK